MWFRIWLQCTMASTFEAFRYLSDCKVHIYSCASSTIKGTEERRGVQRGAGGAEGYRTHRCKGYRRVGYRGIQLLQVESTEQGDSQTGAPWPKMQCHMAMNIHNMGHSQSACLLLLPCLLCRTLERQCDASCDNIAVCFCLGIVGIFWI